MAYYYGFHYIYTEIQNFTLYLNLPTICKFKFIFYVNCYTDYYCVGNKGTCLESMTVFCCPATRAS